MDSRQCLACSNATLLQYLARFGAANVVRIDRHELLDPLLERERVTHLHILSGSSSPRLASKHPRVVNIIHSVFDARMQEPKPRPATHSFTHGPSAAAQKRTMTNIYARVSPSVSSNWHMQHTIPVVPHIVPPAGRAPWTPSGPDLRATLGIPQAATVFCRHGGPTTFNREAAQNAVRAIATMDNATARGIHFIFLNTLAGSWSRTSSGAALRQVHFLRSLPRGDLPTFIRSCDAMLHGRTSGEMFGLALAEFAILNRPIFTSHPKAGTANMHLRILGARAILYDSWTSLVTKLLTFDRDAARGRGEYWNAFKPFEPQHVMRSFACVFLHGGVCNRTALPGTAAWPVEGDSSQAARDAAGADPCQGCSDYYTAFRVLHGGGSGRGYNPYIGVPE